MRVSKSSKNIEIIIHQHLYRVRQLIKSINSILVLKKINFQNSVINTDENIYLK